MIPSSRFVTKAPVSLLLLSAFLAAACGGGGQVTPIATQTASPAPTAAARATVAPTLAPATPAPTPAPVYWPLTGLRADDPATIKRRPLNVRLPNDPAARPHIGLSKADLVFEMIVEGGITRYAAIYHSQDVKAVGPIRSYRFSDLHITQMLRGALVASGATVEEGDAVTRSVGAGNMVSVDAERVGGPYYRVEGRGTDLNNLFVDIAAAREAVKAAGAKDPVDVPPLAFFPSLEHDALAGGFSTSTPATTVVIPFQRDPVTFTYDEGSRGYRRSQAAVRTVDPDGDVPILARNIVVIHTDIWQTSVVEDIYGSLGLDYRMTGGGNATIFRDGRRVDGTWKRDGVLDMFTFYDAAGQRILLEPGQTWIHFAYPTWVVTSEP